MTESNSNNTKMLWWTVGIMGTVILAGGGSAYSYTQARIATTEAKAVKVEEVNGAQNERLATLEAHYDEILRRLGNIDDKLDEMNKEHHNGNN